MAKILVTGGPVHAKLDAVKIVTNTFKGGRMAGLAKDLKEWGHEVTYLTSKHTVPPSKLRVALATHDGFDDYAGKIDMNAPYYDMLVMGAAVANLIPEPPWGVDKKFPSHDYVEGAVVNVPFRVAPRVIDMVKDINPYCTLVGFKLLANVEDEELIRAAYTVNLGARADLVVANDRADLDRKLLVTKERSVIPTDSLGMVETLDALARDKHYHTLVEPQYQVPEGQPATDVSRAMKRAVAAYERLRAHYEPEMEDNGRFHHDGFLFGCIAVRSTGDAFVCSARGKQNLSEFVHVARVDHVLREVHAVQGKASLNAPLLDMVFKAHPKAHAIVHIHRTDRNLPKVPWAPPGTVRDSCRDALPPNFEIEHHGTFQTLTEDEL